MKKLTDITDDLSYFMRDYSSIIKWFVSKSKYMTNKWTDFSVSEPDTLTLSYISYVFDMLNYLVDQKFNKTVFSETSSVKFLSELYRLMGSQLVDYSSNLVLAEVVNRSNDGVLVIDKLDILMLKNHPDELFTSIEDHVIYPQLHKTIKLVRGTPVYFEINKNKLPNGYFILPDRNINRNFIEVNIDGELLRLTDDAIFDRSVKSFSISQYADSRTLITISPRAYRSITDKVTVTYILNDNYQLSSGSELTLLKSVPTQYSIRSTDFSSFSEVSIDDMKLKYYEVLRDMFTIFNEHYDSSRLLSNRIDYLLMRYNQESMFVDGSIDYESGLVKMEFNRLPSTTVEASYEYYLDGELYPAEETIEISELDESFTLNIPDESRIRKLSVVLKIGHATIVDHYEKLILIHDESELEFNYSTTDDNPITNLLKDGNINYDNGAMEVNFNYVPSSSLLIEYETSNGIDHRFELEFTSLNNSIVLDVPRNYSIVPGTVFISEGGNLISDDESGELVNRSSDELVFKDMVARNLLINRHIDDIISRKVVIRKINIDANVYLHPSDTSVDEIDRDIRETLSIKYAKGSQGAGGSIQKVALTLAIENSNPNIKYVELNSPVSDIPLSYNQVSEIGTMRFHYKRG